MPALKELNPPQTGSAALSTTESTTRNDAVRASRWKLWCVYYGALLLVAAAGVFYYVENPPGDGPEVVTDDDVAKLREQALQQQQQREANAWLVVRHAGLGTAIRIPKSERTPEQRAAAIRALQLRDEKAQQTIVGKWDLPKQKKGDYRLELNEDQTGVLTFTPNYIYRVPLRLWKGSIKFHIKWKVKDGHVDMWSVTGTPQRAFETAIKHEGRRMYFHLQKAAPQQLVLKNVKSGKVDDWKRIQ